VDLSIITEINARHIHINVKTLSAQVQSDTNEKLPGAHNVQLLSITKKRSQCFFWILHDKIASSSIWPLNYHFSASNGLKVVNIYHRIDLTLVCDILSIHNFASLEFSFRTVVIDFYKCKVCFTLLTDLKTIVCWLILRFILYFWIVRNINEIEKFIL
jgi:hypothetical protein